MNKNNENSHYVNFVLERLKSELGLKNNVQLASHIGIQPSTLAMQLKRGRLDMFRIIQTCSGVDWNWVLDMNTDSTGEIQSRYTSIDTSELPEYVKTYVRQKENDFRKANAHNNELQLVINQLQKELDTAHEQLSVLKEIIAESQKG